MEQLDGKKDTQMVVAKGEGTSSPYLAFSGQFFGFLSEANVIMT